MQGHLGVGDWSLEPTVTLGLLGVVVSYLALCRRGRLSAQDNVSPWFGSVRWRPAFFGFAIVVAALALESPLDRGGDEYLLTLHMIQHLLLMMVVPPLFLLGIAGMPVAEDRSQSHTFKLWTWITRPWPATVLFNVVMLVWHLPVLYDSTLTTNPIHVLEHISFLATGIIFWWPIIDPLRSSAAAGRFSLGPFQKIAMLVIGGIPPTVLGFVLAMGGSVYYDFYARAPRLWDISPLADQQIAGVIMLGAGNLIYFAAISVIFVRLFGDPADDERRAGSDLARETPPAEPSPAGRPY
jgi:putative membrane protein